MIDISSCLPISGWMSELELEWLANMAAVRFRIIEVGSWCGRSSRALALHTDGTIWCIDTWESLLGGTATEETREAARNAYQEFYKNTTEFRYQEYEGQKPKMQVLSMDSLDASKALWLRFGAVFDMVFLDGAHDYDRVRAEIQHYNPLLQPGGMLCGHDIGHGDVNLAVRELVPDYKTVPDTQLWWTVKSTI